MAQIGISGAVTPTEQEMEQAKQKRFNAHVRLWKSENEYEPVLFPGFYNILDKCLRHWNDASLRMPSLQYKALATRTDGKYTYEQFDVILQVLFMPTAHQLDMSMPEFWQWRSEYDKLVSHYNAACKDAETQVNAEFEAIEAASAVEPAEA